MRTWNKIHRFIHWTKYANEKWLVTALSVFGFKIPVSRVPNLAPVLNSLFDITKCASANGLLRKLQIANKILLDVFDLICSRNNIHYYLSDGTLLGAIRHKGFVPWDDDIDVNVPEEDYARLVSILKVIAPTVGLRLYGVDDVKFGNATTRLTLEGFEFVNLDVFYPLCFKENLDDENAVKKWMDAHWNYLIEFWEIEHDLNEDKLNRFRSQTDKYLKDRLGESVGMQDPLAKTLVMPVSYNSPMRHSLRMSDVLPLCMVEFEGSKYPAPASPERYLACIYEDIYSFPSTLTHHGDTFMGFDDAEVDAAIKRLEDVYKRLLSKGSDGSEA